MIRLLTPTLVLLSLLPSTTLSAEDGLSFVPFVGYRVGGGFDDELSGESLELEDRRDWGFIVSGPASSSTHYELLYARQETRLTDRATPQEAFDLDIHYLHLGGSVDVKHDRFTPFFSGGIGMTHLSPGRGGYTDETRLSLSLGGGLKWYPTDRLGIRFEMRGYGTLLDTSGSLFCDGGCQLELNSGLLPQFETNLGLIFRF